MKTKNLTIMILIVVIAALMGIILGSMFLKFERPDPSNFDFVREREDVAKLEFFLKIKTAITFVNMTLSVMLIIIYYHIWKETKSDFTLGLMIVMVSFFVYAITSCPLIPGLLGFKPFGFGLFSLIPDIFATLALSVLLFISQK